MIKKIQIFFILVLLISCETPPKKKIMKVEKVEVKPTRFVTLRTLNQYNSDKFLFKGTEFYEKLIISDNLIDYDIDYDKEIWHPDYDSIFSWSSGLK